MNKEGKAAIMVSDGYELKCERGIYPPADSLMTDVGKYGGNWKRRWPATAITKFQNSTDKTAKSKSCIQMEAVIC